MVKNCIHCNLEYEAYNRLSRYCSETCNKKQYYVNNIERIQAREKSYNLNGLKKQKNQRHYAIHSEKIKLDKRVYNRLHRDNINAYNREYYKDINNRLRKNLRGRLSCAIQRGFDGSRGGSFVRDLGCSIQDFKVLMENKFQSGMSWENYGWGDDKWHLDHIIPLISFDLTDTEQFKKAAHYTNYQPLWQLDNFKKGAR